MRVLFFAYNPERCSILLRFAADEVASGDRRFLSTAVFS
jgi:hypothetical protein